jgi:molybdopterin converting factor small subunit
MTEKEVNEQIIEVLDELKSRIKEKDDKILEALEDIYDNENIDPDYMMGKSSGHLHSAVEINKMQDELREEMND